MRVSSAAEHCCAVAQLVNPNYFVEFGWIELVFIRRK